MRVQGREPLSLQKRHFRACDSLLSHLLMTIDSDCCATTITRSEACLARDMLKLIGATAKSRMIIFVTRGRVTMETDQLRFILEEMRFSAALPAEPCSSRSRKNLRCRVLRRIEFVVSRREDESRIFILYDAATWHWKCRVPGRGAVRILTVGPGEMVGWSALLDQGRMTTSG